MLNTPQTVKVLKHNPNIIPIICERFAFFEIVLDGEPIAPQRQTPPEKPRQFKTLTAAHAYLRNFFTLSGRYIDKGHS